MTGAAAGRLYTPELLALAVELARYPLTDDLPLRGEARSRSCGSTVDLALRLDGEAIAGIGLRSRACAVGQAAAAIFAREARGRSLAHIADAEAAIARWLAQAGAQPDWPGLELLEPARAYPARHGAILLPWKAAAEALNNSHARS
jgi:NifU-like protein involved in Fe-S cluster formation